MWVWIVVVSAVHVALFTPADMLTFVTVSPETITTFVVKAQPYQLLYVRQGGVSRDTWPSAVSVKLQDVGLTVFLG